MGKDGRWLRLLVGGVVIVYSVLLLGWQVAVAMPLQERPWQLAVSEVFTVWLFAPLLPLALLAAAVRSRAGWLLLAPALWFGVLYGGQLLPHTLTPRAHAAAPTLRVMTWNTLFARDRDGSFVATVRRLRPDVVALQEVSFGLHDAFDELSDMLPYRSARTGGLAVLSRYPIGDEMSRSDWLSCQCLKLVLDWNGRPVHFITTHMWGPAYGLHRAYGLWELDGFSADHQAVTFAALADEVRQVQGPLIVAGDFNTTERQPNYLQFRRLLHNAWEASGLGFGFTYPTPHKVVPWLPIPVIRIDHIWYSPAWTADRAWTGELPESDHLYVVADLTPVE